MSIGERIISLREEHGWTQKELAKRVTINVSVMNRIEANERPLKDYEVVLLANVFNVSADYLLGRSAINTTPTRIAEEATALCETQQHVVNRLLRLEDGAFEKQPEEIAEMLEHFEVYWHVHKQMRKGK